MIERWRYHYNHVRPHSSLCFRPPAPLAKLPVDVGSLKTFHQTGVVPMHE